MLIQLRKNVALLWIFRILAVPVVLVLFAAGFILNLLYGIVGAVGGLVSLLGGAEQSWRKCWPMKSDGSTAPDSRTETASCEMSATMKRTAG